MDILHRFGRLFAYDDWANREVIASLKASNPPARSLKLMSHIIAAELVWYTRIKQEKCPVAVWPDLTLQQCEAYINELKESWRNYLNGLTAESLSQPVEYTNTKGESFATSIDDILTHVIMHSVYHRGQIASDMRASGGDPAYTDFVHCARQGFIE